jgi:hypothetical protein
MTLRAGDRVKLPTPVGRCRTAEVWLAKSHTVVVIVRTTRRGHIYRRLVAINRKALEEANRAR